MLSVHEVTTAYKGLVAISAISIEVAKGEIVCVAGANGAGKSTLLKSIAGAERPRSGTVSFDGARIDGMAQHLITARGIAYVPENRRLFPRLSVRDNLRLGSYLYRSEADREAPLDLVFQLFPRLAERANSMGNQLSGGEQQMLAIGRALMTNPRLLILDEATEGLAPLIRAEIWRCLARLKESGLAILVIDKNVGALTRVADRHFLIERGRVVWSGLSAELSAVPEIQHRYLGV